MRNGLGLFVCGAIACIGGVAPAQTFEQALKESRGPKRFDGNPVWLGEADMAPAARASARTFPGERKAGDVIVELAVTPMRTGRTTAAISLTDPVHGALEIRADAPLIGRRNGTAAVGGGAPQLSISGGSMYIPGNVSWCTVALQGSAPVCIERTGNAEAVYQEYKPGAPLTFPPHQTARKWKGPVPAIEETPIGFGTPATRRLVIASVTEKDIRLRIDSVEGDYMSGGVNLGSVPIGARIMDTRRFPGVLFTVQPGKSASTVNIEFGTPPQ
jgi:hypothetical protein